MLDSACLREGISANYSTLLCKVYICWFCVNLIESTIAMAYNATFSAQLLVHNKWNTFYISKLRGWLICLSDVMLCSDLLISLSDKTYLTAILCLCSFLKIYILILIIIHVHVRLKAP